MSVKELKGGCIYETYSEKLRPLGIPSAIDRVIQEAVSRMPVGEYKPYFGECSYGYRPNRDGHKAMYQALEYLNKGGTWVIDFDVEKYFDTVNHDKRIFILRERMNDVVILHLIRSFLKGVMEDGLASRRKRECRRAAYAFHVINRLMRI